MLKKCSEIKLKSMFVFAGIVTWGVSIFSFASDAPSIGVLCTLPANGHLTGKVDLNPGCIYNQGILITDGNTDVDCRGSVLDGQGQRPFGVFVNSKGAPIANISIKNCIVRNFAKTGVLVTSGVPQNALSSNHDVNYSKSPSHVVFEKLTIENSGGAGVYINDYVQGTVLRDSIVRHSGAAGVYLEEGSRSSSLIGNLIEGNGVSQFSDVRREGLAIDSSAHNVIQGNRFINNAAGGIFTYKNCGEKFSSGNSVIRWQHSDNNTIKNNFFAEPLIGVWVASREGKDLSRWDCGDKSVDSSGMYYNDFSNGNLIEANKFCGSKVAIRVSGDDNKITDNYFDGAVGVRVDQPFKERSKPNGAVAKGNVESGSATQTCR